MIARDLTSDHIGKTLIVTEGSRRRRGVITDVDASRATYTVATVRFAATGTQCVLMPLDAPIQIED